MKEMRVLFLGMLGGFSQPPLAALLEAGFSVIGVMVPVENQIVPIRKLEPATATSAGSVQATSALRHSSVEPSSVELNPAQAVIPLQLSPKQSNIVHLAWLHHIPVYEVSHLAAPETRQMITDLRPDVACVACFNKRIPAALLALPPHGFLNVHPSLLPHFRGPAPLFWTFRAGIQETGVTVHFMDNGLDTGDIAQQARLTLPHGISGPEADTLTGTLGGQLLVNTLNQLAKGRLLRSPQTADGSTQPWPQAADFHIPVSWSARRAFNFMRGTAVFGQPYVIEMEAGKIVVKTAVSYTPDAVLSQPVVSQSDKTVVQFSGGVITAQR